jgi:hypothetical protein
VAQWAEPGAGERFLSLVVRLIDEGVLDEARGPIAVNSDFWSMFYGLPSRRPEWAARIIGHYFERRLKRSLAAGETNLFRTEHSQDADQLFLTSAAGAPAIFVEEVLPFMLRVMELNAVREGEAPWRDGVWGIDRSVAGLALTTRC